MGGSSSDISGGGLSSGLIVQTDLRAVIADVFLN